MAFEKIKKGVLRFFKKTFSSAECVCCGADVFTDAYFCERCLRGLPWNAGFVCEKCGREIGEDYPVCLECKADMPLFDGARSAFVYRGEIVRLIKKLKNGGKYLAEAFASRMASYVLAEFSDAEYLVPVPMTKKAEKVRGYNQSLLLARKLSERTGVPVAENVLRKVRETSAQKNLSRRERKENLRGSFFLSNRKMWRGKSVAVVDDVLTTGATAGEIARILKGAGAKNVWVVTAASVPHRAFSSKI